MYVHIVKDTVIVDITKGIQGGIYHEQLYTYVNCGKYYKYLTSRSLFGTILVYHHHTGLKVTLYKKWTICLNIVIPTFAPQLEKLIL